MKKIFIIAVLLTISSCRTGLITEEIKKGNKMFEKYDLNKWEEINKEYKGKGKYEDVYYFKDGSQVNASNNDVFILPPNPFFYVKNKEFYDNGFIKQKGKYFGRFDVNSYSIKIEMWYEFDEKGNLIKETNEDIKFGKFGYNELLNFLDKKGEISLHSGKNRENLEVNFYFSNTSGKKLWEATINIGKPHDELGNEGDLVSVQRIKSYYLDGNTGEIIKHKDVKKYKDIIPGFEQIYPDLK
jgi:hypothetical protein